jgi:hypothetical protein
MSSNEITTTVIMVPVVAFIFLAVTLAFIISLERTLGRPIPKLRDSLPVPRNRSFAAVPVCMAVSFFLIVRAISQSEKLAVWTHEHTWQNIIAMLALSLIALAASGVIGWIVFAALWVTSSSWRFIFRYISK